MLNVILMIFETGGPLWQIALEGGGVAEMLSWKKSGAVLWLFSSRVIVWLWLALYYKLEGLKSYGHL